MHENFYDLLACNHSSAFPQQVRNNLLKIASKDSVLKEIFPEQTTYECNTTSQSLQRTPALYTVEKPAHFSEDCA
jgi:hypothetical protein